MKHTTIVHIRQGITDGADASHSFGLGQTAAAANIFIERDAIDMLHHIIICVVGINEVEHFHNVGMAHARQIACFGAKLLCVFVHKSRVRTFRNRPRGITAADLLHEELLDGNARLGFNFAQRTGHLHETRGQIRNTK